MLRAKRVTIKWSFTALLLLTCICLPSVICSGNKKNPNDKENNGHSQKTMDQQKNGKSAKLVEPLLSGSDYPTERTTSATPPNTSALSALGSSRSHQLGQPTRPSSSIRSQSSLRWLGLWPISCNLRQVLETTQNSSRNLARQWKDSCSMAKC